MTRKEERIEAAKQRYGEDTQYLIAKTQAFLVGAKWADKTMIDKACDWLKENIDLYSYNAFNTKSSYTEITLTDEFENAFRQAMKGE